MSRNVLIALAAVLSFQACGPAPLDSADALRADAPGPAVVGQDASAHYLVDGARLDIEGVLDVDGRMDLFVHLSVDGEVFEAAVTADDLAFGERSHDAWALLGNTPAELAELARVSSTQDDREAFVQAQQRLLEAVKGADRERAVLGLDLEGLEVLAEDACFELGGRPGWSLRVGEQGASWVCVY